MNWDSSDSLDNLGKYTLADARRLWMVWWNRNAPDLLNLKAKHHAEGQRAFQQLLTEARADVRTDEAIERVAIHMCATTMQEQIWPRLNTDEQDEWRAEARAAIAALLGEEP